MAVPFPWQCGCAGIAARGRDLSSAAGSVVLLCAGPGSRPELVTPFFSSWIGFHLRQFSELVYCMDKKHSQVDTELLLVAVVLPSVSLKCT